jgi:chromosome partitioning protein
VTTRIFAIANQKGGVGKTTSTINLAAFLANAGRKTLVIDLDPQSNTTTGLGVDSHAVGTSIYEVLVNESVKPADVIRKEIRPNLALLPAKVDLYAADIELVYLDNREYRMRHILDQIRNDYEFILIDCPPSLGLLTVNALTAADGVILPLQCEYFALEGMQQLLNTIRLVRDRLNNKVMLFGVVLTMFDSRTNLATEVVTEISQHFPKEKFDTLIPRNIRLSEAPSYGRTILEHDPRSPGALAYQKLAEEVIARAANMESLNA